MSASNQVTPDPYEPVTSALGRGSMPILTVQNIHKRLTGGVSALQGMELAVEEGQVASLLGPSGCGKTTLLRVIAGLETPDQGQVCFAGQDMQSVPVHQRGFGLMF